MIVELRTAQYLVKVIEAIESGKGTVPLIDTCPECGWSICTWEDATRDDGHVVLQVTSDNFAVIIGCEGYWLYDTAEGVDGVSLRPLDDALGDQLPQGTHSRTCGLNHPPTKYCG